MIVHILRILVFIWIEYIIIDYIIMINTLYLFDISGRIYHIITIHILQVK